MTVPVFLEYLRLIRPVNCLLALVGVWLGAYLTWVTPVYYGPLMASIGAFLICAGGNAANDLVDIEIDRINRPRRVLVRGAVSKRAAGWFAVSLYAAGLVVASAVNLWVLGTAVIVVLLLYAYNYRLKRIPLVGNVTVAVMAGLTFMTGGLAVDSLLAFRLPGPLLPASFAFFFHLVREIIKDIEDIEGDKAAGVSSLPQKIGESGALLIALGFFVVLTILTYIPVFSGWFSDLYKVIAVYIVDLPLLALLIIVWGYPTKRILAISSFALKVGMMLGLVALVASRH